MAPPFVVVMDDPNGKLAETIGGVLAQAGCSARFVEYGQFIVTDAEEYLLLVVSERTTYDNVRFFVQRTTTDHLVPVTVDGSMPAVLRSIRPFIDLSSGYAAARTALATAIALISSREQNR